jgi:hypothetical protein
MLHAKIPRRGSAETVIKRALRTPLPVTLERDDNAEAGAATSRTPISTPTSLKLQLRIALSKSVNVY